ncbi:hypothetical protein BZA77DRAFT_29956 [Pyronema omphalodes]|nr:hypothetical protein BZA77DRAFT_29956 [Pyronema omphalodes]
MIHHQIRSDETVLGARLRRRCVRHILGFSQLSTLSDLSSCLSHYQFPKNHLLARSHRTSSDLPESNMVSVKIIIRKLFTLHTGRRIRRFHKHKRDLRSICEEIVSTRTRLGELTLEAVVPLGQDTLDPAEGNSDAVHNSTLAAIDLRRKFLDEMENKIEEIYEKYEPGGREWNKLRKIELQTGACGFEFMIEGEEKGSQVWVVY